MTVATFFTQTLQLVRTTGGTRDEIGGDASVTTSSTPVQGYIEPVSGIEDLALDTNRGIGRWLAFLPVATDVTHVDRVSYDGHTFDVDGPPEKFQHPHLSGLDHIRLRLREVQQ